MKPLFRLILILLGVFSLIFLVMNFSGVISLDKIQGWLQEAHNISPIYLGSIVVFLLFLDLFVTVPTLSVTLLSGYFLGYHWGAFYVLTGTFLAAITGYTLGHLFSDRLMSFLIRDSLQRDEAIQAFARNGFGMIMVSRAVPMLPEVTSCIAGMTRMPVGKFLLAWSIATLPYVMIASYSGSISSWSDPKPAILAASAILLSLWLAAYVFHRKSQPQ